MELPYDGTQWRSLILALLFSSEFTGKDARYKIDPRFLFSLHPWV